MSSIRSFPSTYAEVDAFLGNKSLRTLCNNTTAMREADGIGIRLHDHRIAVLHADGDVSVDDCCWQSSTTKQRLNQILRAYGWAISQRNYSWYVRSFSGGHEYRWTGRDRFSQVERLAVAV